MLPPDGLFFECITTGVYDLGTVIEMEGIGPSRLEDDDERTRDPFIWGASADDETRGWYFRSDDLRPLTPAACEAYAELLRRELAHSLKPYRP